MKCWRCSGVALRQCAPSTRRAEASVSKCGSRYLSTSCPTFAGSRRYASRSLSRSPSMPWAAFCTTSVGPSPAGAVAAGAGCACDAGGVCGCAFATPAGAQAAAVAARALALAATLARVAREELVDQTLEHDGGLSLLNAAAVLEVAVESSGADADVFAPEQPLGLDAGVAVLGNLVVLGVHAQADHGLVVLGIEADALHLAHAHPRHGHRGAHLEVTDVVELGAHVIAGPRGAELHTARRQLRGEKQQRGETQQHEQAGSD